MIFVFAFGHAFALGQNALFGQFGFMSHGTSGGGPIPPSGNAEWLIIARRRGIR
jgi:hypothetical protein